MSESDDTDALLLIPPDIFHVPSSDSEDSSTNPARVNCGKSGVISELVGHMQSLESRISVIESRDNSLDVSALNNSWECQSYGRSDYRQTLPRTRFSVSQNASLQNTPVKPRQSLSVPSTPCYRSSQNRINSIKDDMRSWHCPPTATVANSTNTNTFAPTKHDALMSNFNSSTVPFASCGTGSSHASTMSAVKESYISLRPTDHCANTSNLYYKPRNPSHSATATADLPEALTGQQHIRARIVQEMELSEVDELLQEMEATELELAKRISSTSGYKSRNEPVHSMPLTQIVDTVENTENKTQCRVSGTNRRLDFQLCNKEMQSTDALQPVFSQNKSDNVFSDISLPFNDSFQLGDTDKIIAAFKKWEQNVQAPASKSNGYTLENISRLQSIDHVPNVSSAVNDDKPNDSAVNQDILCTNGTSNVLPQTKSSVITGDAPSYVSESIKLTNDLPKKTTQYSSTEQLLDFCKVSQYNGDSYDNKERSGKSTVNVGTNTDFNLRKYQRLLSLSDFWDINPTRSQEETLRIKLEEEKFRREHCEHLIQELQKRLLEQQEKVAVAVRVDNEKNSLISQFHGAWSKLKQQVEILEVEHKNSQTSLRNVTEKHQSEASELQTQIKRLERELSKALDLAAGYKEKSDTMTREKVDLLKTHADELENYKSLVQEAENRYEQMKIEFNELLEKNQQSEETQRNIQSELKKERLRGGEVRNEMALIHKALDTCEAELTVLKQEKENLQLKVKEEMNRNSILEQKNSSLLLSIDEAKKTEKLVKDEIKSVAQQTEKIRAELQEVYQKQVDEVVKAKLQEFQTQLDTAESDFLEELKTRQQVIAECAARKIKEVIDKHHLEINLLEEKHTEEKRLFELQLAQVLQRSSILEKYLNSQRATKSQLAEQLHSVMQKQWQQALHIISGGNADNLDPIHKIHDKLFDPIKGPKKSKSMPNCYAKLSQESMRHERQTLATQNPMRTPEEHDESLVTMNSIENTPLTSRNNSKDDLRRYVKMITEMQSAREDVSKSRRSISSPPLECREVPRKHYLKKELSFTNEDNMWQLIPEACICDVSEQMPVSQKVITKMDQHRSKPPWK